MGSDTDELAPLVEALESLRREVAELRQRVAAIERTAAAQPATAPTTAVVAQPAGATSAVNDLTPEIIAVIGAALAAYLGVKPHSRQVSVTGGASWAQQGRVTMQASHALTIPRD